MNQPRRTGEQFHALLIGVDEYDIAPPLRGCVRDVARALKFLAGLGVPKAQIHTRTNEGATRDGIIDAIQCHLIENEAIRADDQVLFHYSGHGARMVDPLNRSPSGYIESLVAHDSGPGGAFCIPDTTVAALLRQVERRTPNITVVFDCCHSGSGTRAPVGARMTRPDGRRPPADLDASIIAAAGPEVGRPEGHTLLAACRDRELAVEHVENVDGEGLHQGLFSWCLYRAFEAMLPGLSYAEVMERVSLEVTRYNRYQHPQCEGNRVRAAFDGVDVRCDPFLRVTRLSQVGVSVDGGSLAGVTRDARIAVYPVGTQRRDELPRALCELRVIASRPTEADAVIETDARLGDEALPVRPDSLVGSPALVVEAGAPPWVGRVAFEVATGMRTPVMPPSVLWATVDSSEVADMRVVCSHEGFVLLDVARDERLRAYRPEELVRLGQDLDTIMRFERLGRLTNTDQGSRIQGALQLRVREHDAGQRDPGLMRRLGTQSGEVVLPYDPEVPPGDYGIEVVNDSGERVYAHLLLLNADYSVAMLSPVTTGETAIDPGRSSFVGHAAPSERLGPWLPDDWGVSRDSVLLIATVEPAKLDVLCQEGIDFTGQHRSAVSGHGSSALAQALAAFARGKRMLRRQASQDWGTAALPVTVMRRPVPVKVGRWSAELAPGVRGEVSPFDGQVTAAGAERATYFLEAPAPPLAPLAAKGFHLLESRARGERDVLVLRVEGAGSLTIVVANEDRLVAFCYDEFGHRMAGQGQGGRVAIESGVHWVILARPATSR